eukprot:648078-Pleurochrysis_carterae.AAC.1
MPKSMISRKGCVYAKAHNAVSQRWAATTVDTFKHLNSSQKIPFDNVSYLLLQSSLCRALQLIL